MGKQSLIPDPMLDKKIKRIHKALDSDDMELVTMLLDQSRAITLDQACALHYAVAYCGPKSCPSYFAWVQPT
ncbi:hypothetical protein MLD38_021251 [Melastoma candidum]|uniref:Uncharacterized protein n=1 Tax=Melastoma candidum TaxID=119954 RepID=A0ACB9QER7_9MYRT|nr:hypothetical protein MLD38_021251 [Melastoma candidum]